MIIILFILGIIIALVGGIILGTKIHNMSKYRNCKVVRIRNYIKDEDGVIRKLNK